MLILLLTTALRAYACEPVSAEALTAHAVRAHDTFAKLDDEGFDAAIASLQSQAPCLSEPLSPEQAGRVHAARALASFVGDGADTVPTLQAALSADPELTFGPWLPDNHVIYVELGIAKRMPEDPTRQLDLQAGEAVLINGHPGDAVVVRPGEDATALQPALLQLQQGASVSKSALLDVGEPLPEWLLLADEPISPAAKRRLALGGATAMSALASGALVTLTAYQRDQFLSSDTQYTDLESIERRNRLTFAGAVGAAAVSAGFGTALVVTW